MRGKVRSKPVHVDCVNRFEPLTSQKASSSSSSEPSGSSCSVENIDNMHIDVNLVGNRVKKTNMCVCACGANTCTCIYVYEHERSDSTLTM